MVTFIFGPLAATPSAQGKRALRFGEKSTSIRCGSGKDATGRVDIMG